MLGVLRSTRCLPLQWVHDAVWLNSTCLAVLLLALETGGETKHVVLLLTAAGAATAMNIWVETPEEGTIMLDVEPGETIAELRQQLQSMVTIPQHLYIQALMHDGIHLNDSLSLESHDIEDDTVLSLYLGQRLSPWV